MGADQGWGKVFYDKNIYIQKPDNAKVVKIFREEADGLFYYKKFDGTVTLLFSSGGSPLWKIGTAGTNSLTPIGSSGSDATGNFSLAEGENTLASGQGSHSEGELTISSGAYSHAEGRSTESTGQGSHSEGFGSESVGSFSHAEGQNTTSIGNHSHSEGESCVSFGENSHSEGTFCGATGVSSHAEGELTASSGINSHAEGKSTTSLGVNSHAEGESSKSTGKNSHAGGFSSEAEHLSEWARGSSIRGQYGIIDLDNQSIGAVTNELLINSIDKFTISIDRAYKINIEVVLISSVGDSAEFTGSGIIKNIGGLTSLVSPIVLSSSSSDPALATASMSVSADNVNDYLKIENTGVALLTINWHAKVTYTSVKI